MKTLRSTKPVEYYSNLPHDSREYYLWDIRSMLMRVYPDETERRRVYSRIFYYPMEKLIDIHFALFYSLLSGRPFDEDVLFLEPRRNGVLFKA